MVGRRAGVIVALGTLAFGVLVFLGSGIVHGLREQWVQMASSFLLVAFLVSMGVMGISAVTIDARFHAVEDRLSPDPPPVSKEGFFRPVWVLMGVFTLILFWLALIAASRGAFLKFSLGLLVCTVTNIVYTWVSWTIGVAKRIRRLDALISAREGKGNSEADA